MSNLSTATTGIKAPGSSSTGHSPMSDTKSKFTSSEPADPRILHTMPTTRSVKLVALQPGPAPRKNSEPGDTKLAQSRPELLDEQPAPVAPAKPDHAPSGWLPVADMKPLDGFQIQKRGNLFRYYQEVPLLTEDTIANLIKSALNLTTHAQKNSGISKTKSGSSCLPVWDEKQIARKKPIAEKPDLKNDMMRMINRLEAHKRADEEVQHKKQEQLQPSTVPPAKNPTKKIKNGPGLASRNKKAEKAKAKQARDIEKMLRRVNASPSSSSSSSSSRISELQHKLDGYINACPEDKFKRRKWIIGQCQTIVANHAQDPVDVVLRMQALLNIGNFHDRNLRIETLNRLGFKYGDVVASLDAHIEQHPGDEQARLRQQEARLMRHELTRLELSYGPTQKAEDDKRPTAVQQTIPTTPTDEKRPIMPSSGMRASEIEVLPPSHFRRSAAEIHQAAKYLTNLQVDGMPLAKMGRDGSVFLPDDHITPHLHIGKDFAHHKARAGGGYTWLIDGDDFRESHARELMAGLAQYPHSNPMRALLMFAVGAIAHNESPLRGYRGSRLE